MSSRVRVLCGALALAFASVTAHATPNDSDRLLAQAGPADAAPMLLLGSADFSADMFAGDGIATPGTYELDVYFNSQWVERRSVELRADAGGAIQPCLNRDVLAGWGVDLDKVDRANADGSLEARSLPEGQFCDDLEDFITAASVMSNVSQLRLDVTVPHAYSRQVARDWVDPSQWDNGITAGLLRYNANAYRDESNGSANQSGSLNIDAGLNVGAWRLRHTGSARWSQQTGLDYTPGDTYVQREIRKLGAQLLIGESYSRGDLFSSVSFTGAQLYSDERMLPMSQRGFAPTIRGMANGNSRVSIYQQGRLIHEVSVANGPFEIGDLNASAYGGDLEVVVTAANGSEHRFVQSYAAVPQLLRPGQNRFSAAAGRVRSWDGGPTPYLVEGTWRRGINNALTGYAGLRGSDGYRAAVLGAAINLRIGALATDVTVSQAEKPNGSGTLQGHSYRVTYSKELFERRTNLSLAAYRYSTAHFRDLADHIRDTHRAEGQSGSLGGYRQRSRFDLTVNQRLNDGWGNLWASGNTTSFWDRPRSQTSYSAGYSNSWRNLTFGLNAQRSRTTNDGLTSNDTQFGLSLSMPLGGDRSNRAPRLNLEANRSGASDTYRAGVAGNVGRALHYSAALNGSRDSGVGIDAGANYRARYAEFSGYYSRTKESQAISLGMQGGLVAHAGGVTLAPSLGDTVALVRAEGAAGARINQDVVRVDRRGYAVLGNITPYRLNRFELDPTDVDDSVSVISGADAKAPTLGAVVPVTFRTERAAGTRLVLGLDANGAPLPFGSSITDPNGEVVGMVGQGGQMWLTFKTADTTSVNVQATEGALRCDLNIESDRITCLRAATPTAVN
jgi:outer membrane usher protein